MSVMDRTGTSKSGARHSGHGSSGHRSAGAIAWWLLSVAGLIFAMVVLGGVTRLTESGLSIVEWKPVVGVLPPLSQTAWLAEFSSYKQFPEYQKLNLGMSLAEFKQIFWFEWAHRLLGRVIGVVYLVPFLYFVIRRRVNARLGLRLGVIFVLGGLQGVLGWYMVASGLVDHPEVSAYRLAAHLGLAVVIYGYIIWTAMGLLAPRAQGPQREGRYRVLRMLMPVFVLLVFVTLLSGAFVAGTDSGLGYNTFPLMDGRIVPPDLFIMSPLWRNFFENMPLVQLNHRLLAELTILSGLGLVILGQTRRIPLAARRVLLVVGVSLLVQLALGISTLLLFVPVPVAAAHQAGALLVLTAALWSCHELYRRG